MPQVITSLIGALLCALALATGAAAAHEALADTQRLELGAGLGLLSNPDYRGSAQTRTTVLPVPYVSYRGKRLELSRDGLAARLFNTDSFRLGLSGSGSLPGDDSQDSVRQGMPRLLPTFEIGPSLDWRVSESGGHWDLRLPVRAVAAADLDEFQGIGWLGYPHLRYSRDDLRLGAWELETALGAGPLWASRKYHRYFYRVDPRYATLERPAYDLGGGYSGARATAYLGLRHGPWRLGLGVTHDVLSGAVMRDSPLVETGHGTVIAVGVFYSMWAREWTEPAEADPPAKRIWAVARPRQP